MADPTGAFVPGHVTGFFSPHRHDDPRQSGSRGAGVTLADGVTVQVDEGSGLIVNGDRIRVDPVAVVLEELGVEAHVEVETDLPLGSGFGVSGAISLGTALSANSTFDLGLSENQLVGVAHRAEIRSGTGLGDVVAQWRGGVPIRIEPGEPGHGRLDGIPHAGPVEYVTFGELSTESVLSGSLERITEAGERALSTLIAEPTVSTFMAASRRFASETDFLTPQIETTIDAVSETGGGAAMAMLGETVFAVGTGLSEAGYDARRTDVCLSGASLRSS